MNKQEIADILEQHANQIADDEGITLDDAIAYMAENVEAVADDLYDSQIDITVRQINHWLKSRYRTFRCA